MTEISEAKDYAIETLSGKTYKDVTITWTLKEAFEGVTVEANVIKVAKLPAAKGSITLVATLAVGETTDTVEFFVTVNAEVVKPASIEFTFEGSGKSGHQDGSPASGTLTYTSGDYTLKISSMTKVYNKANDAKGNGALKLGTQSAAAEFTITVPEGFKTVKIYIAGYKANACKFKINGGEVQTTTKASDDGEYDCIEITVPEDGTITLETVSGGYRGMISKIEFVA